MIPVVAPRLYKGSIDRGNSSDFVLVILVVVVALMHWRPGTLSFIAFALSTISFRFVVVLIVVMMLIAVVMMMVVTTMMMVAISESRRRW